MSLCNPVSTKVHWFLDDLIIIGDLLFIVRFKERPEDLGGLQLTGKVA
jgi:hypothetical protein